MLSAKMKCWTTCEFCENLVYNHHLKYFKVFMLTSNQPPKSKITTSFVFLF